LDFNLFQFVGSASLRGILKLGPQKIQENAAAETETEE
jgi:hypothetical protein